MASREHGEALDYLGPKATRSRRASSIAAARITPRGPLRPPFPAFLAYQAQHSQQLHGPAWSPKPLCLDLKAAPAFTKSRKRWRNSQRTRRGRRGKEGHHLSGEEKRATAAPSGSPQQGEQAEARQPTQTKWNGLGRNWARNEGYSGPSEASSCHGKRGPEPPAGSRAATQWQSQPRQCPSRSLA